jgi:hypothetical protein
MRQAIQNGDGADFYRRVNAKLALAILRSPDAPRYRLKILFTDVISSREHFDALFCRFCELYLVVRDRLLLGSGPVHCVLAVATKFGVPDIQGIASRHVGYLVFLKDDNQFSYCTTTETKERNMPTADNAFGDAQSVRTAVELGRARV